MSLPDTVRVHPGPLAGDVVVPGDKSLSHRALILGAMVGTPVTVTGVAASGDVMSTAACLRVLGATIDLHDDADGNRAGVVTGPLAEATDVLDCGNAGTGMRLLAGVVAGVAGLAVLTGDASLRRRPMQRVVAPLRAMGSRVDGRDDGRLPPLTIRGGDLQGVTWESPVASAQVKSCLLLAGLRADGPTTVRSPRRSRDHSERLIRHLGGRIETSDDAGTGDGRPEVVTVTPSALAGDRIDVTGDPSSAAFWLVAAALAGRPVRLPGVCVNPRRIGVVAVLRDLGAQIDLAHPREVAGEAVADLLLHEGSLDGAATVAGEAVVDALDELPALAVAAAVSTGGMHVDDAAELRVKESDRIAGLEAVFAALGLTVHTRPDGFTVPGGQTIRGGGAVHAHGDHRIAMAAAVGATIATAPVEIAGFASVPSSYPTFLDHFAALGGRAEVLQETPS